MKILATNIIKPCLVKYRIWSLIEIVGNIATTLLINLLQPTQNSPLYTFVLGDLNV